MNLLFLHDGALDSGKANAIQVLHMCRAFSQCGQEVTLAVPAGPETSSDELRQRAAAQIEKSIDFSIVSYRKWRIGGRLSMLGGCLGANKLLGEVEADCCVTRNPVYVNLTLGRGLPTVFESHNSILHDNRFLNRMFSQNLLRNTHRDHLKGFVAISQNLTDFWVRAGVPAEKALALHDCVDVESYRETADPLELRRRLKLPLDRKIVAYTGSLYPDREIENILTLARTNAGVHVVLVGGPDRNSARFARSAAEQGLGNMTFTGRVSHARVKDYLFAADVLLMVWSKKVRTINYCSPLKVFEYMAAGRTIVGHGFPTIREVLTDGENALLADPDSFEELNAKLKEALALPSDNPLAQAARELAFERYSWKSRAERILTHLSPSRFGASVN